MQSILDYIASAAIGGMIFLSIFEFYGSVQEAALSSTMQVAVQEDLLSITDVLEYDLRKAGYDVSDSAKVLLAESDQIAFRGDFDDNGIADTVTYRVLPRQENSGTSTLLRTLNHGTAEVLNNNVTTFRVSYFDANGNTLSGSAPGELKGIRAIGVAVCISSNVEYNGEHEGAFWERVIRPKNLR
jgi:hypothetical protein